MADYNILADRVYPGIVRIFGSASADTNYRVVFDKKEQKSNEYIYLSLDEMHTVSQNAGSSAREFIINVDFFTNKKDARLIRKDNDKITDTLDRYNYASNSDGEHQFLNGYISGYELPDEEDKWIFRIKYNVTHHKVY